MKPNRSVIVFIAVFLLIFTVGIVIAQTIADLRATNTARLVTDSNNNGLADGGDVIEYTVNIANCSPNTISGMTYQSDIDPNTSLIPSSIQVTVQGTGLCGDTSAPPPPPPPPPVPVNPIVTTTTPADNATEVAQTSNISITFSEAVIVAGDWFEMVCTTSGTFNLSSANITVTGGPATFILDPTIDLQVGETCVVTVFASGVTDNEALNPLADYVFSFTIETPPTVTATTPTNGAVGVLNSADIIITFDEPVIFTAGSFTLECPAGTPFAGGFAVSGSGTNVATINPTGNLPSGTTCQVVVVASQVSDVDVNDPPDLLDGNGDLVEGDDFTFSFTTDVDAAPFVVSIDPADGAVSVPNSTNITITFSELVNINSAADFSLECGGFPQGYTVTTPAVLPASTTTVVIDPVGLPDASVCTVTVFTSVTDSDMDDPPDNMLANFVSTFTTEAPPSVTTTNPANLATGVSTGVNIVVNFDEPVDVTTSSFIIECPVGNPPFTYSIAGSGTTSITLDPTINLPANQTCTVTVVANQVSDSDIIDPPNNMLADYVFTFDTVADTAPVASSPLDGATGVATGSNIVINFNEPVDVTAGAFVVECPVGSPVAFTTIPALPTTNQTSITIDPTFNLPATSTCAVTVLAVNVTDTDTDEPPDNMAANYNFTFDTLVDLAPIVDQPNIFPASTSTGANSASLNNAVSTTPTITIPFSEAVDVASGAFTLVCNASSVGVNITPPLPATNQTSFNISPSVAIAEGANCVLTVVAANVTDTDTDDPPNNMVTNFTLSFAVDTAPAEILTETEVGNTFQDVTGAGANNVDLDSDIRITFNEAVTVTFPANGLQCPAGNNIPVTVTTNNAATIVLNPNVNLPLNTACVLNIPAANISDVDTADLPDNPVAGVNHTFTTADDDAPTVTTNPAAGGSNIAVNSNITVTFNEPVTLTGAWFTLSCTVSGVRTSTGELTGTGITIIEGTPDLVYTIDPTADFATGDVCTITIDSANVVDNDLIDPPNELDGDASGDVIDGDADDYVAVFTTTDTAPQVISTTPTSTATVGANQTVTLNFSEAVDIGAGAFTFECPAGSPITGGFNTSVPLPASAVTTITLTPVDPLPFGANCVVTAESTLITDSDPVDPPNQLDGDNSGDLIDGDADDFVLNFTVDAPPNEITTSITVGGISQSAAFAVNVDLDTNIVVSFTEPVNANLTSFTLDCGGAIAFTVLNSGTATITVDPTPAALPINTLCTFDIIAANITDVDAFDPPDTMITGETYTFTTVNDNPPSVTTAEAEVGGVFTALSFTPPIYADPDTDLRITFSEAVTVTGNWAELNCTVSGVQDVAGGLAVTDADPVFTLNPATNLTPAEDCTLTIFASQVADEDAPIQNMSANAVFTFTVQDAPPRVVNTVPASFDVVPNNQTLTINFTEAVDIALGGITWTCGATNITFTPALPQTNLTSIVLTPTTTLPSGICTVFLESTLITDVDPIDPPSELDGDYSGDIVDGDADDYSFNFVVDFAPQVSNTTVEVAGVPTFLPLLPAQRADVGTNIVVNFNENINATASAVTLDCGAGAIPFTGLPVANNTSIVINPTSDLPGGATCTLTILSAQVSDTDTFDPPNQLDGDNNGVEGGDYVITFTTQQVAIDDAYTVTPHLTYTSSAAGLSVRDNDQPTTATITGFGATIGTANGTAPGGIISITGGAVVLNADGTFIFYPIAGFSNTSTSFFYTVDNNDTAEVTINVQNQEFVWFVDNTPTAPAAPFVCLGAYTGTQACPAPDLSAPTALDTDNDTIFVAQGNYTCLNTTLQNGERFVGDGSTSNLAAISGVTPVAGSSFPAFSGIDPVFTSTNNCLVLASNNTIRGIEINDTTGYAMTSVVNIGTALITETNITGIGGLLNFSSGGTFNAAFEVLSSSAHSARVINLTNMGGAISNTGGAISNNANADTIAIGGGTVSLTLFSTVNKTGGTGNLLTVAGGHATGTLNFLSGISHSSATGGGVQFNNADGNYLVNGNLAISAGTAGVNIENGSSGTMTFVSAGSSITGVNGISFRVNNSTANISYAGTIEHTAQTIRGIEIIQGTGTITFTGNIHIGLVTTKMTGAVGVFLADTGATNPISFNFIRIDAGDSGNASFPALISQTSGRLSIANGEAFCNGILGADTHCINISNTNMDTITFGFLNTDYDDSGESGGALALNNTTGTFTVQNSVGMSGFNASIIQATNFGTLNIGTVTTANMVTTNRPTININTGAINITAESVSMFGGAANGIIIQNTTGSFTVTGTGVAGSGGTIQNTTSHGINLNNVTNISLNNMLIQNTALSGVYGTEVTNFTFTNGQVSNIGTAASSPELSCWAFNRTQVSAGEFLPFNNLDGTVTLTNNTCTNPYGGGLDVTTYGGTISNATVTGNTFTSTTSTTTSTFTAITFRMNDSPSSVSSLNGATISNNIINNFPSGGGISVGGNVSEGANTQVLGSLATPITISNNTISGQSAANRIGTQGILLFISGRGSMYSIIDDNDITHVTGNGISASAFGDVTARVFVTNNTIIANNSFASQGIGGGPGVDGTFGVSGNLYITVTGNNISQVDGNGILLVSREGSSILNADVRNNTVAAPLTGVRPGIRIDSGNATSVDVFVCLNISGNISAGSGGHQGLGLRKQGAVTTTNDFAIVGMAATATPGVEAYVDGLNPLGNGTLLISATSGFSNCTLP